MMKEVEGASLIAMGGGNSCRTELNMKLFATREAENDVNNKIGKDGRRSGRVRFEGLKLGCFEV